MISLKLQHSKIYKPRNRNAVTCKSFNEVQNNFLNQMKMNLVKSKISAGMDR